MRSSPSNEIIYKLSYESNQLCNYVSALHDFYFCQLESEGSFEALLPRVLPQEHRRRDVHVQGSN